MSHAAEATALTTLYSRRQIFIGDLWAGLAYRQAHDAEDKAEFYRLAAMLDVLPPPVRRAVEAVVIDNRLPSSPIVIDRLAEGLDHLYAAGCSTEPGLA